MDLLPATHFICIFQIFRKSLASHFVRSFFQEKWKFEYFAKRETNCGAEISEEENLEPCSKHATSNVDKHFLTSRKSGALGLLDYSINCLEALSKNDNEGD